jgi:hypothetical protein
MAQTGFTPIQLYSSSTATNVPLAANLATGELAINITDGKLFYKDNASAVQVIGWKVVPATAGGTGQTSYAVGDLIYADTTTTLAKLADIATGNALISGGVGVAPSYGKIGLTTHVSGTLPVGNGGTGQASNLTQYGIVYGSTTTAMATTAAGTSTQVLHGNASGAPTFSAVSLTADVSGTLPVANGGFGNTVGSLPVTTVTFTNLSTSFVDVGTLDAGAVVCISLFSVAGVDCVFIAGMSYDGSNLNVRTTNISGATVAAVGADGTVIIGGDATRTYTIGRNPSNGYYRIKSSLLATGTTTLKYTYFGQR